MKLSEKQKMLIAHIELQANASAAQLAEETGLRPHVVRHALDFLKEKNILFPNAAIDPAYLGLVVQGANFSYPCQNEKEREKLLDLLKKTPEVSVARELAGEYQFGIRLVVPKPENAELLFAKISQVSKGYFSNKIMATWLRWSRFRHKIYSDRPTAVNSIDFGRELADKKRALLDDIDRNILRHLAAPVLIANAQIARLLKLPKQTVDRRVKRMEEAQVICGYGYSVSGEKCGLQTYRLLIWLRQQKNDFFQNFFSFAQNHPYIKQLVQCSGNWDYELGLRTEHPREVPVVVQSIYTAYPDQIASIKLLPVLARIKRTFFAL